MTVTTIFTCDTIKSKGEFHKSNFADSLVDPLCEGACLNSNAFPKIVNDTFE